MRHRKKAAPMVYFKCSTCRIRLYGVSSTADPVGDLCPSCGALLEPVGELSEVAGFRSIKSRDIGAPGRHQQIAGHVDDFLSGRKTVLTEARDEADRWLDDGGSFRGPPAAGARSETKA